MSKCSRCNSEIDFGSFCGPCIKLRVKRDLGDTLKCSKCLESKPAGMFYAGRTYCKKCHDAPGHKKRKQIKRSEDEKLAYQVWRKANTDKIKVYRRKAYLKTKIEAMQKELDGMD